ncbi:TPA: hypothetical protein DEP90_01945 [Patescibacteria group bacterium]|nr:hypothetical protein [Patescibacteria group bacterium]
MNRKWNPNWLVLFTICLLVTALTMFLITIKDQLGLKKCVYGDGEYSVGQTIPDEPRCYCNEKGVVVCDTDDESENTLESSEYINDDLSFSSKFLNFLEVKSTFENVRFSEVSSTQDGFKIIIERLSMCSKDEELPPQIGYYMFLSSDLYLTTTTNLLSGNYGKECMVSNTFLINTDMSVSKIYYQSEDKEVYNADICIFDGKIYNTGDAFVGENGEVVMCE